jgi:alpha-amylase/alpha-mannosidase (GH57 family)
MNWINFLHFYQPANIDFYVIKEALDKSYWRLIRLMEEHPYMRMTWNVSGCLLERLYDAGEQDFLRRLSNLIKNEQVEITSTAAYHGLLPLLPKDEVVRQIKENESILRRILGVRKKPKGFFLPEMAYSPEVAKIIKSLGYKWIIIDEIAIYNKLDNKSGVVIDSYSGLEVVLRSRSSSREYPPAKLLSYKKNNFDNETDILITATDAELYGLRHEDPTGEMEAVAKNRKIKTYTISEFIEFFKKNKTTQIKKTKLAACSWDSSSRDVKNGTPFKLWSDKNNIIHRDLWRLATLALSLDKKFKKDINYKWYRWHLVRGLASCTFWWASEHDFSKVFGPYAWSPDIIERGLEDMIRAIRSLGDKRSRKYKLEAEKYYLQIKKNIWHKHWNKHWQM